MNAQPVVRTPTDGDVLDLGGVGVRFLLDGLTTSGRFSVVEHPLAPRVLAAPMHRHRNEDEYSFIIAGSVGMQLGDAVLELGPGAFVHKPRDQWHTFWNAADEPASLLELISPAGFEDYFREIAAYITPEGADLERLVGAAERFGLEFDMASVARLVEEHNLVSEDQPPAT